MAKATATCEGQQAWGFAPDPADPAASERDYQRNLMADKRAKERDIEIPAIVDPARRGKCRLDAELFMATYGKDVFYHPFTPDQRAMVDAIVDRVKHGGAQALAAARGDGKSSITKWVAMWALLYGHVNFLVIVAANAFFARMILADIKYQLEFNDGLCADFPEVCVPVRCLEGASQRARSQTVAGERTRLEWSSDQITLPTIETSVSSGAIICARGIDAPIRGLVRGALRPDMVIIDDPQTRESAASLTETASRRETILQDIMGLAGPGQTAATVMLCTVIRCDDLADEFTDRRRRPAWSGIRQRFLVTPPTRDDLWNQYITIRQQCQAEDDPTGRKAHAFYAQQKNEMDAGAVINNPYRYNNAKHDDGSHIEVSALEHAYNRIADMGRESFDAELQNDPHSLTAESVGINDLAVCRKLSNVERGTMPEKCSRLTVHVDVHGRRLDWVAMAWSAGLTGYVIDYGEHVVHSPAGKLTADENIEHTRAAILSGLLELREVIEHSCAGRVPDCVTVDSGWQPEPVYRFCKIAGSRYRATKGFGSGYAGKFRVPTGRMAPSRRGARWFISRPPGQKVWLVNYDADHYKQAVHTGYMTPLESPGSLSMYGETAGAHREFARQICAEVWVREFRPGKGWIEGFNVVHHHNHKLDCVAGCMLGAELSKIKPAERADEQQAQPKAKKKRKRITFAERRARA